MLFSRCTTCGKIYSPTKTHCPECGAFNIDMEGKIKERDVEPDLDFPEFEKPEKSFTPPRKVVENVTRVNIHTPPVKSIAPRPKNPYKSSALTGIILFIVFAIFLPVMTFAQIGAFLSRTNSGNSGTTITSDFMVVPEPEPEIETVIEPEKTCPPGYILSGGLCTSTQAEIVSDIPKMEELTSYSWWVGYVYNADTGEIPDMSVEPIMGLRFYDDMTAYLFLDGISASELDPKITWSYEAADDFYYLYDSNGMLLALASLDADYGLLTMQFLSSDNVLLLYQD